MNQEAAFTQHRALLTSDFQPPGLGGTAAVDEPLVYGTLLQLPGCTGHLPGQVLPVGPGLKVPTL